jgi:hypothetical protein
MSDLPSIVWRAIVRMSLDEPSRAALESLLRWVFGIEPTMAAAGLGNARYFLTVLEALPLAGHEEPERARVRAAVLSRVFGEEDNARSSA